jgi:hypothetical protein
MYSLALSIQKSYLEYTALLQMIQRLQSGALRLLEWDSDEIPQHIDTRYVNITKLCQLRGKTYSNWRRLNSSQSIIDRVTALTGLTEADLIVNIMDGPVSRRATWMDLRLAAVVAAWVDPMFTIHCATLMQTTQSPVDKKQCGWERQQAMAKQMEIDLLRLGDGQLEDRDRLYLLSLHRNVLEQFCKDMEEPQTQNPDVRTLALAVAMRLGHPSQSITTDIARRISSHVHHDRLANRDCSRYPPVEPWHVALLLRAQSFRCLDCDAILTLTMGMAGDRHTFSLGRIWNHLPHTFPNLCVVCKCHNNGERELKALRKMLSNDTVISGFQHLLDDQAMTWAEIKDRNLVVEFLAPDLLIVPTDHLEWVTHWVHVHESLPDAQFQQAQVFLDQAQLGPSKRQLLDTLDRERSQRFKRRLTESSHVD